MGCATSKQSKSRCRQCQAPYGNAPMTRRSFSMNVHHPPVSKGDTYHVVALTSSTLGSIKLDDHKQKGHDHDDHKEERNGRNDDVGNDRNEEFQMGVIEAKAWSKMIDEKITRVGPRTPIRTPPGEPETINVNDLMEGLEDTSPLRLGEHHLRSFSFHVSTDSIPSLIDSPRVIPPQDHVKETPKKSGTWFDDLPEKENLLANGDNVVSKALISEFDPEVISAFRKALEELSPSNPFHLKPRDREQLQQVVMSGVLDEDTDTENDNGIGVKAVEVTEKTLNGVTNIELIEEKKVISGDGIEENKSNGFVASNGHAHVIGFVDKFDEKDVGSVLENGFAHTNGYLDTVVEEEEVEKDVVNVVENGHLRKTKERVVLYFTSLRGVRKTYEDCCYVRLVLKGLGVRVDERDVSMHSGFKEELKELLGEGFKGGLPKVFAGERFIGGVEEIRRMHEEGKLEKVLDGCEKLDDDSGNLVDVCEACGDVRFMPCETCSGSCKIYYECEQENEEYEEDEYGFQRCPDCNENGLVRCPICCY